MNLNKRLDKLEKSLTPKQLVVLWLQEIQPYRNVCEYVQYLRGQPERMAPITRMTGQIDQTVRESMKGQPKEAVSAAVRRSVRDVVFLVKLHLQVNYHMITEDRVWWVMYVALERSLQAITQENSNRNIIRDLVGISSREIPYPLETEPACAVSAAIRNHVTTWDELDEDGTLFEWLNNHLLDHGGREIPEGAYEYDEDGKCKPLVNANNEKEVRECFKDDGEFERFKSGDDYTKGLATTRDAEYDAHYGAMLNDMRELVDSGKVQGGSSVYLETVPVPFLQVAPLVEGEWLDRYVVTLAEVGATFIDRGYQLQETSDHHPLAWPLFTDSSGGEVDQDETRDLCQRVGRRLKRFPGRKRVIAGQPYISFADYCSWRGRKVKGDLSPNVSTGFTTSSWNAWLDAKGEKGRLAGAPLARLRCYVSEHDYLDCPDGVEGRIKRRAFLMSTFQKAGSDSNHEQVFWKDMAGVFLCGLYAFRQAVTTISQQYFNGEELLFPDLVRSLAELIKHNENLVATFNNEVVGKTIDKIDLEAIRQGSGKAVKEQISYLVDKAKAEALDCLGDEKAARKIAEKYI